MIFIFRVGSGVGVCLRRGNSRIYVDFIVFGFMCVRIDWFVYFSSYLCVCIYRLSIGLGYI